MPVELLHFDRTDAASLARYASVPMSLDVHSILEVRDTPGGGFALEELPVDEPWLKDYREDEDEPESLSRFTCAHNAVFCLAIDDGHPVGAAKALRYCEDAEYFGMINGRTDVAVLADIRVAPSHKGQGIGQSLFDSVATWARSEGIAMHVGLNFLCVADDGAGAVVSDVVSMKKFKDKTHPAIPNFLEKIFASCEFLLVIPFIL